MCRVHTERFYWRCAHYTWRKSREDNGSCNACRKQEAYRLVWHDSVCPSCLPFNTNPNSVVKEPEHDDFLPRDRIGEDKEGLRRHREALYRRGIDADAERTNFNRRVEAYKKAIALHQKAITTSTSSNSHNGTTNCKTDPELEGICTEVVPRRSLPLRFPRKTHLLDQSHFSSPEITVVPPGVIPKDRQRCGVCWGDLSLTGVEGCEGGWPRMLACGHIYGKQCIADILDRYGYCPLCTQKYSVRRQGSSNYPSVAKAFDGLVADPQLGPRRPFVRGFFTKLLSPIILAVVLTMDVGPRLRGDDTLRRANLPTKIAVWLACILLSPAMYAYILWQACMELL